jgi:hypothetical protein
MGLKEYVFTLYIFPLSSTHLWLRCSNGFNDQGPTKGCIAALPQGSRAARFGSDSRRLCRCFSGHRTVIWNRAPASALSVFISVQQWQSTRLSQCHVQGHCRATWMEPHSQRYRNPLHTAGGHLNGVMTQQIMSKLVTEPRWLSTSLYAVPEKDH